MTCTAGSRSTVHPQLSTPNPTGTVLVLVVALLALVALLVTTLLVTVRYEAVAAHGTTIEQQLNMLLSLHDGALRRILAEDLWGDDVGHNRAEDAPHEGYDAPDAAHPWLRGICGKLITWEPAAGDPDYTQPVVATESDWPAGTESVTADGVYLRYAVLVQDLGGLVNVNVARRPDPDMVGGSLPGPNTSDPDSWPYTLWAFHAARGDYSDWGYWWWDQPPGGDPYKNLGAMGRPFRGGGPLAQVNLAALLQDPGDLGRIDGYLRTPDAKARYFNIQDELDLRFPGTSYYGGPYRSLVEALAPSLFSETPVGGMSRRRRFVTAVGRTVGWQRRREPIRMHPYDDAFWDQAGLPQGRTLCQEDWYMKQEEPIADDWLKYLHEARMGYRVSVQRGVTFSQMYPDDELNIYDRLVPYTRWAPGVGGGTTAYHATVLSAPGLIGSSGNLWPPPKYQYDDWTVNQSTGTLVLLMANLMALHGVPAPGDPADDAASYAPRPYAHTPAAKSDRLKAYQEACAAMLLNMADYQDRNGLSGMLSEYDLCSHIWNPVTGYRVLGYWAGAEQRAYLSEVVLEFEAWPDYFSLIEITAKNSTRYRYLIACQVNSGSPAYQRGLRVDDRILYARRTPAVPGTPWTEADKILYESTAPFTITQFRQKIQGARVGDTIDVRVDRPGTGQIDIAAIPLDTAVRTLAAEVYNPSGRRIYLQHIQQGTGGGANGLSNYRYGIAVTQQAGTQNAIYFRLNNARNSSGLNEFNKQQYCDPGRCMLYVEQRDAFWEADTSPPLDQSWRNSHGLAQVPESHFNCQSNALVGATYAWNGATYNRAGFANFVNLRPDGGVYFLLGQERYNKRTGGRTGIAYLADALRNQPDHIAPAPMPVSHAADSNPPEMLTPKGVAAAFAEARSRMTRATNPAMNPVVRLYKPLYMETRSTWYMVAADSWMNGSQPSAATKGLGSRIAGEEDAFTVPGGYSLDYRNVDARGYAHCVGNQAFRFGGDVSRLSRLLMPSLASPDWVGTPYSAKEHLWVTEQQRGASRRAAPPPEVVDEGFRAALAAVNGLSGSHGLSSGYVRRLLQKAEARLRFSPYSPDPNSPVEMAECAAMYDFVDAFTAGGAVYDNVDNNLEGTADEHRKNEQMSDTSGDLNNEAAAAWPEELNNCWPAYGRINVNTAPLEVLQNCLMAPDDQVRRELGQAIWDARGGEARQDNPSYQPFKTLCDLYCRVSIVAGRNGGFDRYGFDGHDNHFGGDAPLPDMAGRDNVTLDPLGLVDDIDERNYLWRINSEVITLRSDTFAVYLRLQARSQINGRWRVLSERRVYSIWDRANCFWPPIRHASGNELRQNPDFRLPQRLATQIFGF